MALMITEFLDAFEDSFPGKLSQTNAKELRELIGDLTDDERESLYKHIKFNYKKNQMPTVGMIYEFIIALGMRFGGVSGKLHAQSPLRMVQAGENMTCKEIVDYCKKIRKMYDLGEEVTSRRQSFLINWEYLVGLDDSDQEIAKRYILERDINNLYDFLDVVTKKVSFSDIKIERNKKITSLNNIMDQFKSY